jgi:hypothetical protein
MKPSIDWATFDDPGGDAGMEEGKRLKSWWDERPPRVAIVDRDMKRAAELRRVVEGAGCIVRVPDGPESAADLAESFRADVVLLRLQGDAWGEGAYDAARVLERMPWVGIVLYTAFGKRTTGAKMAEKAKLEHLLVDESTLFRGDDPARVIRWALEPLVVASRAAKVGRERLAKLGAVLEFRRSPVPASLKELHAGLDEVAYPAAFEKAEGNVGRTADLLGVARSTCEYRLRKLGLLEWPADPDGDACQDPDWSEIRPDDAPRVGADDSIAGPAPAADEGLESRRRRSSAPIRTRRPT